MASEFSRIGLLQGIFGALPGPGLGIGDDAAVLPSALAAVVTVDVAVEGVHFSRAWVSLDEASERAVEAAMSDAAAMGARLDLDGCGLLLAWTLPRALTDDDVASLARGAQRAARRASTPIVGGNLSSSPSLSLTTTVIARAQGPSVTRAGARPGDVVAVTGVVGAAALGLRALERGADLPVFVDRWKRPCARLDLGCAQVGRAHAMIDLSDGLVQDAGHLAGASSVRLVIDADRLPMLADQRSLAASLGLDAIELALTGGEDYELLATGSAACFDAAWTVIGTVESGQGVRVLRGGRGVTVARGFDHFG